MQHEKPKIGSKWKHSNGCYYKVVFLTNEETKQSKKYPVTVVYKGENGKLWSRPLNDWYRSMTTIDPIENTNFNQRPAGQE